MTNEDAKEFFYYERADEISKVLYEVPKECPHCTNSYCKSVGFSINDDDYGKNNADYAIKFECENSWCDYIFFVFIRFTLNFLESSAANKKEVCVKMETFKATVSEFDENKVDMETIENFH